MTYSLITKDVWLEKISAYIDTQYDDDVHDSALSWVIDHIVSKQSSSAGMAMSPTTTTDSDDYSYRTIQQLILLLEDTLTSIDDKIRNRSSYLLANVISTISPVQLQLDSTVVHLLVVFFCRRLGDYPSILPSLHALIAIVVKYGASFDHNTYNDMMEIYRSIFNELKDVQSLVQSIRQRVFELIHELLLLTYCDSNDAASTLTSGTTKQYISIADIINGIVQSVEGERDPRCLLLSLKIIRRVQDIYSRDLDMYMSDMIFDIIASYYPITFVPPPDDPFGVSPEELTNILEDCLCGNNLKETKVIPLFLENMEADSTLAKVRSMICLTRLYKINPYMMCKKSDNSDKTNLELLAMQLFLLTTGSGVSSSSEDNEDNDEALEALHAGRTITEICGIIGKDAGADAGVDNALGSESWVTFIEPLLKLVMLKLIGDGDGMLNVAVSKAAVAVARSHYTCCKAVLDRVMPLLLPKLKDTVCSIRSALSKSLSSSLIGIKYLPPLVISSGSTGSSSNLIAPTYFQILDELLLCIPIDCSSGTRENDPFDSCRDEVFSLLSTLFSQIEVPSDRSHVSNDNNVVNVPVNVSLDISLTICAGIKCLQDVLGICHPTQFNQEQVVMVVEMVTFISVVGTEALWHHKLGITGTDHDVTITAASSLLVAIANIPSYDVIIKDNCFPLLISNSDASTNKLSTIYKTLSSLSCQGSSSSIMSMALPYLLNQLQLSSSYASDSTIIVGGEVEPSSHFSALIAITDLFASEPLPSPSVSSPAPISGTAVASGTSASMNNEDRALCFSGIANAYNNDTDASLSPLLQVVKTMLLASNTSWTSQLSTLLRRLMLSITDTVQQSMVITSTIDFMFQFINDHRDNNGCAYREHVLLIASSLLVYLNSSSVIYTQYTDRSSNDSSTLGSIINYIYSISINDADDEICKDISHIISSITNKLPAGASLDAVICSALSRYGSDRDNDGYVNIYLWLMKSILIRPDVKISDVGIVNAAGIVNIGSCTTWQAYFIQRILHHVEHDDSKIVYALSILTKDHMYCFRPWGYTVSSLLWRQKLWSKLFPSLRNFLKSSQPPVAGSKIKLFLSAISGLAVGMQSSVIMSDMNDLVSVTVQSLSICSSSSGEDNNLKLQSLELLEILLSYNPNEYSNYINTIVPILVDICQSNNKNSTSKMRMYSLKCILMLVNVPYIKLHPVKNIVIRGLQNVLDDNKRIIRRLASKAINNWIVCK